MNGVHFEMQAFDLNSSEFAWIQLESIWIHRESAATNACPSLSVHKQNVRGADGQGVESGRLVEVLEGRGEDVRFRLQRREFGSREGYQPNEIGAASAEELRLIR